MKNLNRRSVLNAMPAAAAGGFALNALFSQFVSAQGGAPLSAGAFERIAAESMAEDIKALETNPGTKHLFRDRNFIFDLTVEEAASAKEFEWHEGRDHIFQILDGSTEYEVGGTPQSKHGNGPGEWLAPVSEGTTRVTLKKGDVFIIRRNTPHRRTTADRVALTLISAITPMSN